MTKRSDYNNHMRLYMKRRYVERRRIAVEFLGGKCAFCGSIKDLQIDHRDPSKKRYSMARALNLKVESMLGELRMCQLLCGICHRDKTLKDLGRKLAKGTHGSISAYRYCGPPKCDLCRKANSDRMREYYKTHPRKR